VPYRLRGDFHEAGRADDLRIAPVSTPIGIAGGRTERPEGHSPSRGCRRSFHAPIPIAETFHPVLPNSR